MENQSPTAGMWIWVRVPAKSRGQSLPPASGRRRCRGRGRGGVAGFDWGKEDGPVAKGVGMGDF